MHILHRLAFATSLLASTGLANALEASLHSYLKYIDYQEFDLDGSSLNHETGFIPGIELNLKHTEHRLWASYADGGVNYDGQLQSGTPHTTDTDYNLLSTGYEYMLSLERYRNIHLLAGLSGHRWQRHILPANGIQGVNAVYQWQQLHAGIRYQPVALTNLPVELNFSLIKAINGTVNINLNTIGLGSPQLDLGDKVGFQAGIKYFRELSNKLSMNFLVESSRWEFGRSKSRSFSNGINSYTIAEPRSVSWHTSLGIELVYKL